MKKIAIACIVLLIAYLALSSPGGLVINASGETNGIVNSARKALQGANFWREQAEFAQKELDWELAEPGRQAQARKEMQQFEAELRRDEREFYQQFPDARPSPAERKAEALRERADAIEQAELDRELEAWRLHRIAELRKIQTLISAKIQQQNK